jgi:4-diphosphocytidyl-2-C-methyl-D-erythritol kinase
MARVAAPTAVRVHAPAKVNLGLWILGRRPDGYHEIDTVLHSIDLEDELVIERLDARGFRLSTAGRPIPGPGPNLVERAWERLVAARPELGNVGVAVQLTKRIPPGAGLGGGSSDAAGLLAGANEIFQLRLEATELEALAAELGSDVPFFVRGGAARATGRGETLRHLRPMPPTWGVLALPPVAVSTGWAYGLLKKRLTVGGPNASILASAVARGDVGAAVDARFNAFEDVVLPHVPYLVGLKQSFVAAGAWGPLMSGSGSSFFTLARTEIEARAVAAAIAKSHADVRVLRTRERGVTVSRYS